MGEAAFPRPGSAAFPRPGGQPYRGRGTYKPRQETPPRGRGRRRERGRFTRVELQPGKRETFRRAGQLGLHWETAVHMPPPWKWLLPSIIAILFVYTS